MTLLEKQGLDNGPTNYRDFHGVFVIVLCNFSILPIQNYCGRNFFDKPSIWQTNDFGWGKLGQVDYWEITTTKINNLLSTQSRGHWTSIVLSQNSVIISIPQLEVDIVQLVIDKTI